MRMQFSSSATRRRCQGRTASDRAPTGRDLVRLIATTTATGWGAGKTCVDDRRRHRRCRRRRLHDRHLPTADGAACDDDYYYDDDDCRGEDPPDDGRRATSHSGRGGCRRHPPRAGCVAPVAVFAVAVRDGPLAPPASAAVVAVIRRHLRVDRVEPLHPRHVGRGGNQYCFPIPPPLTLAAP